jgi:hypothetical protein
MRVTRQAWATPKEPTGLNLAALEADQDRCDTARTTATAVKRNDELFHDTSDSESVPNLEDFKNGQVQFRAHARAAFASKPSDPLTINIKSVMLFHIELAQAIKSTRYYIVRRYVTNQ